MALNTQLSGVTEDIRATLQISFWLPSRILQRVRTYRQSGLGFQAGSFKGYIRIVSQALSSMPDLTKGTYVSSIRLWVPTWILQRLRTYRQSGFRPLRSLGPPEWWGLRYAAGFHKEDGSDADQSFCHMASYIKFASDNLQIYKSIYTICDPKVFKEKDAA
ncbi:hypothetical protein TNCV_954691 [Trichonephila clavipes]|nr:hypothetical protein TNCV_954691 [Trichonephila clavipes]